MSQRAVEAALGKLVCDSSFRSDFYRDAETAAASAGFDLTPVELTSLHKIELDALEAFAAQLDERVQLAVEPRPRPRKKSAIR
jgi:hypothetical protein